MEYRETTIDIINKEMQKQMLLRECKKRFVYGCFGPFIAGCFVFTLVNVRTIITKGPQHGKNTFEQIANRENTKNISLEDFKMVLNSLLIPFSNDLIGYEVLGVTIVGSFISGSLYSIEQLRREIHTYEVIDSTPHQASKVAQLTTRKD